MLYIESDFTATAATTTTVALEVIEFWADQSVLNSYGFVSVKFYLKFAHESSRAFRLNPSRKFERVNFLASVRTHALARMTVRKLHPW